MANPHVTKANKYAREVLAGKIPASDYVKLACKKHLAELDKAKTGKKYPFYFSPEAAEKACDFVELLPHAKGKWARDKELIKLEPWQCFIFCVLFGWLRKKDKLRRFRKAYIAVPRKNGKSVLAAGIGLYMFIADGEYGAEVYCGATKEKQAWEVFRPAKQMLQRSPELQEYFDIDIWAKALFTEEDESRFEPVVGKPGDGSSPSCAIADEYHEHDSNELVETMLSGMGAREQPLLLMITTAGYNIAGPCYDQELDAKKMLEGVLDDEELFAIIYGIDAADDWSDPKVIKKANPNLGVSISEDFLLARLQDAKNSPRLQTVYKTKSLNVWCSAKGAWLNLLEWNKCADYTLRREQFKGCENWVALDLASKSDICTITQVFKKIINGQEHYYAFGKYMLPEAAIEGDENERYADSYRRWVIEGFLEQHDGAEIDYDLVKEHTLEIIKDYKPVEVAFDPYKASHMAQQILKDGFDNVIEFGQTVKNMSLPMKELEAAIKSGRFHHDGNPLFTWMASNVIAKLDAKDNIYPRKEKKELKIDGIVATIMAIARAMAGEVTEQPGITIL